jgi:hypothetical protein
VHSALHQLRDLSEVLKKGDSAFFYSTAMHAADAPAPGLTPGAVMALSETSDGVTSRIDVVPRDEDALERYGPQFSLIPTDDEAGVRAATQLEEALRAGRPTTIEDGLQLVPHVMPPALSDMIGRPISGRIEIGESQASQPSRPIPEWDAWMRADSQPETASIPVRLRRPQSVPEGWDASLVGHYGGLRAEALFRTHAQGGELRWNFKHARDDSPARQQLAALELMEALSEGGELIVVDRGRSGRPELRVPVPSGAFSDGTHARALIEFFRDIRAIETWAATELNLPDEISGDDARHVAVVANMVRSKGRSIRWQDASMEIADTGTARVRTGSPLRIEQEVSAVLFGREVALGRTQMDISSYEVASITTVVGAPNHMLVRIKPTDADAADVFERLLPLGRSTRRPPPPPPPKAARKRKQQKRKRK